MRTSLRAVDPLSAALRWPGGLTVCRPYSVAGPNSLWHIGNLCANTIMAPLEVGLKCCVRGLFSECGYPCTSGVTDSPLAIRAPLLWDRLIVPHVVHCHFVMVFMVATACV